MRRRVRNYLRVRGEYVTLDSISDAELELPPRARRILGPPPPRMTPIGTTSACAENTCHHFSPRCTPGNYLRVRGEYSPSSTKPVALLELPPRARRIPRKRWQSKLNDGTTSACAENTKCPRTSTCLGWNYLRVRGEYLFVTYVLKTCMELPPRARRIPIAARLGQDDVGTTSACAENTLRLIMQGDQL